jgi:hypothetical protein
MFSSLVAFAATPAAALTITYVGNDYTNYSAYDPAYDPSGGSSSSYFTMDDLKAAALSLGPHMSITVTIHEYYGNLVVPLNGGLSLEPYSTPELAYYTSINITSGSSVSYQNILIDSSQGSGAFLSFTNGAVTGWYMELRLGCDGFGFLNPCRLESGSNLGDHVYARPPYPGVSFEAHVDSSGTWSAVAAAPVPGPIVGAGLPGLLMAIAGFIGWRRSRRSIIPKRA